MSDITEQDTRPMDSANTQDTHESGDRSVMPPLSVVLQNATHPQITLCFVLVRVLICLIIASVIGFAFSSKTYLTDSSWLAIQNTMDNITNTILVVGSSLVLFFIANRIAKMPCWWSYPVAGFMISNLFISQRDFNDVILATFGNNSVAAGRISYGIAIFAAYLLVFASVTIFSMFGLKRRYIMKLGGVIGLAITLALSTLVIVFIRLAAPLAAYGQKPISVDTKPIDNIWISYGKPTNQTAADYYALSYVGRNTYIGYIDYIDFYTVFTPSASNYDPEFIAANPEILTPHKEYITDTLIARILTPIEQWTGSYCNKLSSLSVEKSGIVLTQSDFVPSTTTDTERTDKGLEYMIINQSDYCFYIAPYEYHIIRNKPTNELEENAYKKHSVESVIDLMEAQ